MFGDKIRLTRTITSILGENEIHINDKIENFGFKDSPFVILYHINAGFPLLDKEARLFVDADSVESRNEHAETGIKEHLEFTEPMPNYEEMCYFHKMNANDKGIAKAALVNKKLDLALELQFNQNELPYLTEWKMMGEGEYVLGIEPTSIKIKDRQKLIDTNSLPFLKAGERKEINIKISILNGADEISSSINY